MFYFLPLLICSLSSTSSHMPSVESSCCLLNLHPVLLILCFRRWTEFSPLPLLPFSHFYSVISTFRRRTTALVPVLHWIRRSVQLYWRLTVIIAVKALLNLLPEAICLFCHIHFFYLLRKRGSKRNW